ncbi:hypothetical protein SEA_LOZINAK_68 [Gordonia phage Lozinak]|uniref:Uncharacterized protein n=2 Tax=Smoothievirus smoothie TaxID=1982561 RepID=A0A2D1GG65_9CAUD|nr:hypothetical protein BEN60_gp138 [Gordonia phage Smoothie]ANA86225.1 hypothetical protein PBI_SMOOTHIE_69 [Gordonia phage Smoothie]ATN90694.1 hypothetical protein SEA_LOZINAK_68 [Gordonia phage Lozinak]
MTSPADVYYSRQNDKLVEFIEGQINGDLAKLKYQDVTNHAFAAVGIPAGSVRRRNVDEVAVAQLNALKRLVSATRPLSARARWAILDETARSQKAWRNAEDLPLKDFRRQYFRKLIHVPNWTKVFCEEINATFMWVDDKLYYFDPERDDFADEISDNWTLDEILQKTTWVTAVEVEEWAIHTPTWWESLRDDFVGIQDCGANPDGNCCGEPPRFSYEPKPPKGTRSIRKGNLQNHYAS